MTTDLRVLNADDEPHARERLQMLLSKHARYRVVAECADGDEAVAAIDRERPDVAFLDISMPGQTGLDVARTIVDAPVPPAVVFVTAYDQYALAAFEVSAVDYLVKPVDRERFDQMLSRLERRLTQGAARPSSQDIATLLEHLRIDETFPKRFVVRGPRGHYFVKTDDVETATAEGNYVALIAGGRQHLIRETMKSLETKLDPSRFVRIHRSTIVSIDAIARIESMGHGLYRVTMNSGARFESSAAYGGLVQRLLR
jgi:two-component system LytT family response regulator